MRWIFQSGNSQGLRKTMKRIRYTLLLDKASEDAFQIRLSSGYYYVPTKMMFDMLGFDYEHNTIMFDLIRQPSLDADLMGQAYLMKQRINKRKDKVHEDITIP